MYEDRDDGRNRHQGGIGWRGQLASGLISPGLDGKRALGALGVRSRRDVTDLAGSEIDVAHDSVIPFLGETKPVIVQLTVNGER